MPLYIDIHELGKVSAEDVAKAHLEDMRVQGQYGVNYIKYWVNEGTGKVFCLCDAPNSEAAVLVHREAHGLEPGRVIEVQPEIAEGLMGGGAVNAGGAVEMSGGKLDCGTRTILFTDLVGSTTLTQQLGDKAAMDLLEIHNHTVRVALIALAGREVKHTGDGIMASFVSAEFAVKCATRILRDLGNHPEYVQKKLRVRVGAAAGEPVERHGDFFGSTVQLAARLCSQAEPGQALVSTSVVELCSGKGLSFRDLGEVPLKGFERPVQVHVAVS